MKKKIKVKSVIIPTANVILAVLSALLFYAARATWVFVDIALKIDGFMVYLLYAMVVNAALSSVLAVIGLYDVKRKGESISGRKVFSVFSGISTFFSVFSLIVAVVFIIIMADRESAGVYTLYLKGSLYDAALFVLVSFLALFLPLFKGKVKKMLTAVALFVFSVIVITAVFPVGGYEFTSDPTIIDTGKNYSVVFSTSKTGTGYVEYTYEGESYKVYDNEAGRLNTDSKIHSINVPYAHLNNNTYKVGSVRVIEQYSYGSRLGKEILSDFYTFTPTSGSDVTYLVVSDWHTEIERAYDAVQYVDDYDGVILMGDASPGLDFEDEAVRNIVEFSGELTKGTMPVIYARGNHETRGAYAGKLCGALGLDEFYYTVDTDSYSFVVLDSGEDKDDSHPEYGKMTDYNTYRAEMTEWLKSVEVKNQKVIVLSHAWQISEVERELSDTAWTELDRLGARLLLSGHSHDCRLLGVSDREKETLSAHPDIIGYMDGGNREDSFVASKITLSEKEILVEAYSSLGEKVFAQKFDW